MSGDSSKVDWNSIRNRVSADRFFFGWALSQYASFHRMTESHMATALKCEVQSLVRLSLCRLPNDKDPSFQSEIRRISEFVPCDPDQLVMLLREVIATNKLANHAATDDAGLLMAARDRKRNEKDDDQNGSDNDPTD